MNAEKFSVIDMLEFFTLACYIQSSIFNIEKFVMLIWQQFIPWVQFQSVDKGTILLQALRKIGQDRLILMLCMTVFLSYLPEAGEYSCFFVYLRLVSTAIIYFNEKSVKFFILSHPLIVVYIPYLFDQIFL